MVVKTTIGTSVLVTQEESQILTDNISGQIITFIALEKDEVINVIKSYLNQNEIDFDENGIMLFSAYGIELSCFPVSECYWIADIIK